MQRFLRRGKLFARLEFARDGLPVRIDELFSDIIQVVPTFGRMRFGCVSVVGGLRRATRTRRGERKRFARANLLLPTSRRRPTWRLCSLRQNEVQVEPAKRNTS